MKENPITLVLLPVFISLGGQADWVCKAERLGRVEATLCLQHTHPPIYTHTHIHTHAHTHTHTIPRAWATGISIHNLRRALGSHIDDFESDIIGEVWVHCGGNTMQ